MLDEAQRKTEEYLRLPDRETGEEPPSRLKDAAGLRAIWDNIEEGDRDGSYNRGLVRQLLDGHPPFDQGEREEEGQGDLFNVNTGKGRLLVDEGTSGLMDIFNADRNLVQIPLSKRVPESGRHDWQRKIETRFTNMLRNWDAFVPRITNLCFTEAADGVAIAGFESEDSWKIFTAGLAEMKFHRYAEPVSTQNPIAVLKRDVHVGTLWEKVRDPKAAKKKGWNRDAVLRVIHSQCKKVANDANNWRNWEKLEEDLKANESYVSTVAAPVEVLYGFVTELDGKVSFYAASLDGEKDFMQARIRVYDDANSAYQIFPYSTGTNNRLYTIRGLGYFVYQPANAENIMFSNLMNAARVNGFPQYQATGTEEIEDASFVDMGWGTMIPPGVTLPERQNGKNLQQSLIPAYEIIQDTLRSQSGGLSELPKSIGERSNESNIAVSLETMNKMQAFAISLFYPPLDRIYREMVRRVFVGKKDTPESKAMKKALIEEDGVPKEVLDRIDIDNVRAYRILGGGNKGSALVKQIMLRNHLYASLDAQGRKQSDFDLAQAIGGQQIAEAYVGEPAKSRKVVDEKIAELENHDMLEGTEIEPFDGEDHLVHLRVHVEQMLSTKDAVEEGTVDLADYTLRNYPIWQHANKTLAMLSTDATLEGEANELRAQVQRLGEYFSNGIKAIRKQQREGGPAQEQGGEQQEQVSDEQMKHQSWLMDEQRKSAESQAKIQRDDAQAAAKVARDTAVADAKAATEIQNDR